MIASRNIILGFILSCAVLLAGHIAPVHAKSPAVLKVAIDSTYSPFTIVLPASEPTGLFVDIWRLWSEETGVSVEFVVSDWPGTLQNLRDGQADVHSGLTVNEQRAEWMDFSQPIHKINTSLFFRADEKKCPALNEMAGKRVGALKESYQHHFLDDKYPEIKAASYSTREDLFTAVLKGEVDAALIENSTAETALSSLGLKGKLKQGEHFSFSDDIAVAVLKGRKDLLEMINSGFDKLPLAQLAKLERRWLTNPKERYYELLLLSGKSIPKK